MIPNPIVLRDLTKIATDCLLLKKGLSVKNGMVPFYVFGRKEDFRQATPSHVLPGRKLVKTRLIVINSR